MGKKTSIDEAISCALEIVPCRNIEANRACSCGEVCARALRSHLRKIKKHQNEEGGWLLNSDPARRRKPRRK